ncbi:MAG: hypothetical protein ABJA57_04890, partial [Ginsengibacter sp.]
DSNHAEMKYLESIGTITKWQEARFRRKDIVRYAEQWGLDPHSPLARVAGHRTWLTWADIPSHSMIYYSIVKICPPPYNTICP